MNKRLYGMAPGGRMALDRAANRRRNIWHVQRQARARERRVKAAADASVCLDGFARATDEVAVAFQKVADALARKDAL